jgi:hypothetical protein
LPIPEADATADRMEERAEAAAYAERGTTYFGPSSAPSLRRGILPISLS